MHFFELLPALERQKLVDVPFKLHLELRLLVSIPSLSREKQLSLVGNPIRIETLPVFKHLVLETAVQKVYGAITYRRSWTERTVTRAVVQRWSEIINWQLSGAVAIASTSV